MEQQPARTCDRCGEPIGDGRRAWTRFCSDKCRIYTWRAEQRREQAEQPESVAV